MFSAIQSLRERYLHGETDPLSVLDTALAKANSNAGRNVYLAQNVIWARAEAAKLQYEDIERQPLWGIPISLKDCFDLAGFSTSCGSSFYREHNGIATKDSAIAERLRATGAVITGKTHLHQLAYGITGENRDFGDCVQPRNATLLTGGSSSGAVASVQEGSALAAIGTDTGGSIRVPAALCGLAGYRSSLTLQDDLWRGGAHLAPSFDTLGWLYRDLRDGPWLAEALFSLTPSEAPSLRSLRIGVPHTEFLHDCEPDVMATLKHWQHLFSEQQVTITTFDATHWNEAFNLFAPIQAHEAAALHRGHFQHFEPAVAERLVWGANLSEPEIAGLRLKLAAFREATTALFQRFDYLLLPCSPMSALFANKDQSQTRMRILRYTTPISLAGLPAVTLPGDAGGLQLAGPRGSDAELLALSAKFAEGSVK
jgi:Asp-tRNA(Asn)/Glu-tRNA(Gln) amidotransferase A subunit family amidase